MSTKIHVPISKIYKAVPRKWLPSFCVSVGPGALFSSSSLVCRAYEMAELEGGKSLCLGKEDSCLSVRSGQ